MGRRTFALAARAAAGLGRWRQGAVFERRDAAVEHVAAWWETAVLERGDRLAAA